MAIVPGLAPSPDVLLGDGSGAFPTSRPHNVSTLASGRPVLADVDNDGHLDMILNTGDGYAVGLGDGTGQFTFARHPVDGGGITHLTSADVNNDGNADLLLIRPATDTLTLTVLLGDGSGAFTP